MNTNHSFYQLFLLKMTIPIMITTQSAMVEYMNQLTNNIPCKNNITKIEIMLFYHFNRHDHLQLIIDMIRNNKTLKTLKINFNPYSFDKKSVDIFYLNPTQDQMVANALMSNTTLSHFDTTFFDYPFIQNAIKMRNVDVDDVDDVDVDDNFDEFIDPFE